MSHPTKRSAIVMSARISTANSQLKQATTDLSGAIPTTEDLYAAVEGAMKTTVALAELVDTIRAQAPSALKTRPAAFPVRGLQADLHAMHGCLTTAPLLLAPSRDDLANVIAGHAGNVRAVAPQPAGRQR